MERNFHIEPEDVEVYLSDTAMFQCAIESVPAANITWYKGTVDWLIGWLPN